MTLLSKIILCFKNSLTLRVMLIMIRINNYYDLFKIKNYTINPETYLKCKIVGIGKKFIRIV